MQIHELPTGTIGSTEYSPIDNGSSNRKVTLATIGTYILDTLTMTLGGVSRTVKDAIDAHQTAIDTLNSNNVFNVGTEIPGGANLNSYTVPGNYYNGDVSNCVNTPVSASSSTMQMWVIPRATLSRVFQLAFIYLPASSPAVYIRAMTGASTWSAWTQL